MRFSKCCCAREHWCLYCAPVLNILRCFIWCLLQVRFKSFSVTFETFAHFFEAGFSGHHASILINSGAIHVLSSILSLHLNGKQQDIVHLACKCLLKLASARLSDESAASAAASILKCPLMHALAVLVAPPLPPPSPKFVKSKSSQSESITSVATAAVCSIVQSCFIW